MNETTISGNVSTIYGHTTTRRGDSLFSFDVAIDNGYFDRTRGEWVKGRSIYERVVAYRRLADNAAATLIPGMAVTVTGKRQDNSYVPDGSDQLRRGTKIQAEDISTSLRFATATVVRNPKAPATEPSAPAETPAEQSPEPAQVA